MEPIGFKDGVTVLFEFGTVPALALLASAELDHVRLSSRRLGTQAVTLLGGAMFALFVPAFMLGGGEHHSAGEMAHAHGEEDGHGEGAGDEHGHDGEELAQAGNGHAHGDGTGSHDGGGGAAGHGAGEHGHEGPATAATHRSATGHAHGGGSHGSSGGGAGPVAQRHSHPGGGDDGGGDHHGDRDHGERDRGDERAGQDEGGHDHGGGDGGQGDGGHDHGGGAEAEPSGNYRSIALESGHGAENGQPARGPAVVIYDQPDERLNGEGHDHAATCEPTPEQRAAADAIVSGVSAELRQYENNPAEALADGFNYVFGPTDRMVHMVHLERQRDPDVLKPTEIESFIYYMTDTGFVPIGGMFVMPEYGMSGPEPGGVVGRWATAGTSENTPAMMHVFTYPGLDPWGHYNGRDLAPLWTPGRWIPSVCRSADDANNGCLP
jgi:hypothetical protein